jgi:hypothetical protein
MRTDPFRMTRMTSTRRQVLRFGFESCRATGSRYARAYRWLLHLIVHAHRDGSGGGRRSAKDTHSQDGPRVCLSLVYRLI